jgi:hypothetical protein
LTFELIDRLISNTAWNNSGSSPVLNLEALGEYTLPTPWRRQCQSHYLVRRRKQFRESLRTSPNGRHHLQQLQPSSTAVEPNNRRWHSRLMQAATFSSSHHNLLTRPLPGEVLSRHRLCRLPRPSFRDERRRTGSFQLPTTPGQFPSAS